MPDAREFVFLARRSMASAAAGLLLVAFDRATLPWYAGQYGARERVTAALSCSAPRFEVPTTVIRRNC
jgi:hypothetical protein